MHQRKSRSEHTEKQQALALERMQKLVEESAANLSRGEMQPADDGKISRHICGDLACTKPLLNSTLRPLLICSSRHRQPV